VSDPEVLQNRSAWSPKTSFDSRISNSGRTQTVYHVCDRIEAAGSDAEFEISISGSTTGANDAEVAFFAAATPTGDHVVYGYFQLLTNADREAMRVVLDSLKPLP